MEISVIYKQTLIGQAFLLLLWRIVLCLRLSICHTPVLMKGVNLTKNSKRADCTLWFLILNLKVIMGCRDEREKIKPNHWFSMGYTQGKYFKSCVFWLTLKEACGAFSSQNKEKRLLKVTQGTIVSNVLKLVFFNMTMLT